VAHGHDVHFLERLERLSTPQTELALSLYQDPLLIRALLEQLRLPDGAARVALSLAETAARSSWSRATVTSSPVWPRACPQVTIP
jgi:hypothetical protein